MNTAYIIFSKNTGKMIEAHDELRRLHALNAELLEALKLLLSANRGQDNIVLAMHQALSVISKAEGREA